MNNTYQVGDHITDWSNIYEITDISQENVYYKPVLYADKVYTASIPVKNLEKAGIRRVITAAEAGIILKDITNSKAEREFNTPGAREVIFSNNPINVVPVLVYYWANQEILAKADKDLMEQILEHLSREIAWVTKRKPAGVKEEMTKILNKRAVAQKKTEV